jgi:hypothetical protein
MKNETTFWAIVELMGHQKVAGELSEFVMGGSSFIRVDVPETEEQPGFTRFLTDKAIYAINPVTEEVAKFKAAQLQNRPIESWDFRSMLTKQLQLEGKIVVPATGNVVTVAPNSYPNDDPEDDFDHF